MNLNPDKVVKIQTVSKEYSLYFGMRALRGFEIETGRSVMSVFASGDVSLDTLGILVKHGLQQAHPEVTDDDVNLMFDEIGIPTMLKLALDAVGKSIPSQPTEGGDTGNGLAPLVVGETP